MVGIFSVNKDIRGYLRNGVKILLLNEKSDFLRLQGRKFARLFSPESKNFSEREERTYESGCSKLLLEIMADNDPFLGNDLLSQEKKMADKTKVREQWGTRAGFVIAGAGAAVGLGNVMKFPWMTGKYGGAAFLFVYVIVMLLVGVTMLLCDFLVGRNGKCAAIESYRKLNANFVWMGYLGILCGLLALSYYAVFGGWMLYYMLNSFGTLATIEPDAVFGFFGAFISSTWGPLVGTFVFMLMTCVIAAGGIRKGIERASKFMMPVLLIILVILVIRAVTLPGAFAGIVYYLKPDFSQINLSVIAAALGQVFFSLNVGTTTMVNYGSYLSDEENVPRSTAYIVFTDFAIAFTAGLMVIPSAFAFNIEPGAGPALLFVTMPSLFAQLPFGGLFCFLFFVLLLFASLTSSVSILEIFVPNLTEHCPKVSRAQSAYLGGLIALVLAVPVSFSFGMWSEVKLFGMTIFELYDNFICRIAFPLIAMCTAVLVGWLWGKEKAVAAYSNNGQIKSSLSGVWFFLVRYLCPVFLLMVVLNGFGIL